MRSKALPPARAQGHIVPFLEAAALFAALCIFARTAALMLAAAITAPLPMAETLFWLGRQSAQEQQGSGQGRARTHGSHSAGEFGSLIIGCFWQGLRLVRG